MVITCVSCLCGGCKPWLHGGVRLSVCTLVPVNNYSASQGCRNGICSNYLAVSPAEVTDLVFIIK